MTAVCAIVFALFAVVWLYGFQANLLAVAQHQLSGGATRYNAVVGTVLILGILLLIQRWTMSVLRLPVGAIALTFFPSTLVMSLLCSYMPGQSMTDWLLHWAWLLPLLVIVLLITFFLVRNVSALMAPLPITRQLTRPLFTNLLVLVIQFLAITLLSNTDEVTHRQAAIEASLMKGDYHGALRVGERAHATSPALTVLRAYALSKNGHLGDSLFRYPIDSHTRCLLPEPLTEARLMLLPTDSLWKHLGARGVDGLTQERYLHVLQLGGWATKAVADYQLCLALFNKQIDRFVSLLPRHYALNDSLPIHYKEALTLYTHLRTNPQEIYKNEVTETDFKDFQALQESEPEGNARRLKVYEQYFGTYWWYYYYE